MNYSEEEIRNVLKYKHILVFDTNIWLDFYSYPKASVELLFDCFRNRIENFWIPYQVYDEFTRNYKKVRGIETNKFNDANKNLETEINKIKRVFNNEFIRLKNKGTSGIEKIQEKYKHKIEELLSQVTKDLKDLANETIHCGVFQDSDDIVSKFVDYVISESTIPPFEIMEKLKIYEEGELRYKYKISPGYTDAEKPEIIDKYGDLVLWKEILRKVEIEDVNVILIQNEKKLDWWTAQGKIQPVLIEEFNKKRIDKTKNFYMMSFEEFLKYGERFFDIPAISIHNINEKIIDLGEIKESMKEHRNRLVFNELDFFHYEDSIMWRIEMLLKDKGYINDRDKAIDFSIFQSELLKPYMDIEKNIRTLEFRGALKTNATISIKKPNEFISDDIYYYKLTLKINYVVSTYIHTIDKNVSFFDNLFSNAEIENIEILDFEIAEIFTNEELFVLT